MVKKATMKDVGGEPNLKIEEMFAIVAVDEQGEGIMGISLVIDGQLMMTPLVGADMKRIEGLIPHAKQIQAETGTPFKIYKFSNKQDVTEEFL
jgi:hypothetical protein